MKYVSGVLSKTIDDLKIFKVGDTLTIEKRPEKWSSLEGVDNGTLPDGSKGKDHPFIKLKRAGRIKIEYPLNLRYPITGKVAFWEGEVKDLHGIGFEYVIGHPVIPFVLEINGKYYGFSMYYVQDYIKVHTGDPLNSMWIWEI